MKKILVTGGCGFIGRAFCKRLLADGHHVTIVDNLLSGQELAEWMPREYAISQVEFIFMNAQDYFRTTTDVFDEVYHFAAIVGGRLTIENQPLLIATDLAVDSEMFNWLVRPRNKETRLIYFSSSAAYPLWAQLERPDPLVLTEDLITLAHTTYGRPDSTYGFVKLAGEVLAQFAVQKHSANIVIYRPFGGYGEDQSYDYPFPSIIKRVLNREDPIVVWGSGKQCRDFIHIDDIVDAVFATKDRLASGSVLNLGTGRATSFIELARLACLLLGHRAEIVADATKPEGVFYRVADTMKLSRWYRHKIPLEQGIMQVAKALDSQKVLV